MIARIIDFMREQHPFNLLAAADLERINASARSVVYDDGAHTLTRGGDVSKCLYLLGAGPAG